MTISKYQLSYVSISSKRVRPQSNMLRVHLSTQVGLTTLHPSTLGITLE